MQTDPATRSTPPASNPEPPPRRSGLGILGKTVAAMLLVGLVPLVLFGAITLTAQREAVRADAGRSMQATAERIGSVVDEWVDKNVRALQAAARLSAVTSMSREQQTEVLTALQKSYPWIYLAFTVAPDGQNVARSDEAPLTSYADRQYFKDVAQFGKALAWENLIGKTSKKPALVIAVPIKVNDRLVGVLAAAMAIEDISRTVATWKSGKTGFAFLVDQNGKVIAHPRSDVVLAQASLAEQPLVAAVRRTGLAALVPFDGPEGAGALGYGQPTQLSWVVGVQQDQGELFAPVREALLLGAGLLLAAALLVALIARYTAVALVRPVRQLAEAADQMSTGELEVEIPAGREDEIGRLAASLERLRRSMKAAMDRLAGGATMPPRR